MQAIARDYGFTGTARRLRTGARQPSRHEVREPGRDAGLRDGRAERAAAARCRSCSSRQPRAKVGVRPIPPDREASQASNYVAGTADGSRQAWFNMNTYRPRDQVKYTVEALVLHETVPGPSSAGGAGARARGRAAFQRSFSASAFSEGWALVCRGAGHARLASSTAIRRRGSAGSRASDSGRCGWWSIPACMPWAGRASGPASTSRRTCRASRWPRWIATSRMPAPGARLQARTAQNPRTARPGAEGARRAVRSARLPRRGPAQRHDSAGPPRGRGRYVYFGGGAPLTPAYSPRRICAGARTWTGGRRKRVWVIMPAGCGAAFLTRNSGDLQD